MLEEDKLVQCEIAVEVPPKRPEPKIFVQQLIAAALILTNLVACACAYRDYKPVSSFEHHYDLPLDYYAPAFTLALGWIFTLCYAVVLFTSFSMKIDREVSECLSCTLSSIGIFNFIAFVICSMLYLFNKK